MKVPAYCKCHAKRAVFTCAPKKLDTFSSFRPGQTVTKHCACHTILRVSLKVTNHESPTYCKCHAKRAVFTCAPKKLDTFSSFRPGQTVTKYCACHTILRVSLKVANHESPTYCKCHAKRAVFTCAPKKLDTFSSFRPGQTVTKYCACHTILRVSLKVANHESPTYCKCHAKRAVFTCAPKKLDTLSSSCPGQTVTKYCACHTILRVSLKVANHESPSVL